MTLILIISVVSITASAFFMWEMDEFPWGKIPDRLRGSAKRLRKIEQDGQAALKSIQNLHETKKRLNKDFQDDWNKQFRLLLPPPATPHRNALRFVNLSGTFHAYCTPQFPWDARDGVKIDGSVRLTPVAWAWGEHNGDMWFAFNNVPGNPHELLFIRSASFEDMPDRWWFTLPRADVHGDTYIWSDNKAKAIAGNLKETVKYHISS